MPEEEINYEEEIRIDPEMLDFEWIEQPNKMMKYCSIYARASRDVDLAKETLDIVRAELNRDMRAHPEKFGINVKITEDVIKNNIILQSDYIAANHALIEKKYFEEMARSAVRAFDQRKDALENLARLHGQSYFAGPKVPHDLTGYNRWRKEYNPKISIKRNK